MIRTALVLLCLVMSALFAVLWRVYTVLSPKPIVTTLDPTARPGMDPAAMDDEPMSWSDAAQADRERLNRPETVGSDAWLVDAFDLEEGERQWRREQTLLASAAARRPPN